MNAASGFDLRPEVQSTIETYLSSVRDSLCAVDPALAEETVDELRSHLLESMTSQTTAEEAQRIVDEAGAPDDIAIGLCEALESDSATPASGTFLGMPYDLRVPTAERVASRWWNPRDARLFVPRAFGVGWDLNFGALAVRLHLIEPDAEDEPFGQVSDRAFMLALLVPVALTAGLLGSFLAVRPSLPAEVPVHWNIVGEPDRWAGAMSAFLIPFGLALVTTVWAAWSVATSRPKLSRGAVTGFATFFASLGVFIWSLTLATTFGVVTPGWLFPLALVASLLPPLFVLTLLARSGRAAEMKRDLTARRDNPPPQ